MNDIIIRLDFENAKRLARFLRQMNNDDADELATSLGSYLGICSATDDQDELDEELNDGETVEWNIYSVDTQEDSLLSKIDQIDDEIAKLTATFDEVAVQCDRFTAQNSDLTEFEKLKFFRDLLTEERLDSFRKCGIEEKVIAEITNHHHERLMLNQVIKDGHAETIRGIIENG